MKITKARYDRIKQALANDSTPRKVLANRFAISGCTLRAINRSTSYANYKEISQKKRLTKEQLSTLDRQAKAEASEHKAIVQSEAGELVDKSHKMELQIKMLEHKTEAQQATIKTLEQTNQYLTEQYDELTADYYTLNENLKIYKKVTIAMAIGWAVIIVLGLVIGCIIRASF